MRVGIAGLGTVGAGVVTLLRQNADRLAERCGRRIEIAAVSARDRNRRRDCDLDGLRWEGDARRLAAAPDIDVVVELIGGAEGAARDLVEAAIAGGKQVVTANKALIAHHGAALARRADAAGVAVAFEARSPAASRS
jgi:homoserine dehydrogenase